MLHECGESFRESALNPSHRCQFVFLYTNRSRLITAIATSASASMIATPGVRLRRINSTRVEGSRTSRASCSLQWAHPVRAIRAQNRRAWPHAAKQENVSGFVPERTHRTPHGLSLGCGVPIVPAIASVTACCVSLSGATAPPGMEISHHTRLRWKGSRECPGNRADVSPGTGPRRAKNRDDRGFDGMEIVNVEALKPRNCGQHLRELQTTYISTQTYVHIPWRRLVSGTDAGPCNGRSSGRAATVDRLRYTNTSDGGTGPDLRRRTLGTLDAPHRRVDGPPGGDTDRCGDPSNRRTRYSHHRWDPTFPVLSTRRDADRNAGGRRGHTG